MRGPLFFLLLFLLLPFPADSIRAEDFVWAGSFGGPGNDRAEDVAVDGRANVYTVGQFLYEADFDPGPDEFVLTSNGGFTNENGYLAKLNSKGDLLWARVLGGAEPAAALQVELDGSGNVHAAGRFLGTVKFDPGPPTFELTSVGTDYDTFLTKHDAGGAIVWARQLGASEYVAVRDLVLDDEGNLYAAGFFEGTADFDPGPGTFERTSQGIFGDGFVCKLDSSGNFVWAAHFEGSSGVYLSGAASPGDGGVHLAGRFTGTVDLDPGPETFSLDASSGWGYVARLDASGDFVWGVQLARPPGSLVGDGGLYISGTFEDTVDFDPGPGVSELTAPIGSIDTYILKLDDAGNFTWVRRFTGDWTSPSVLALDKAGDLYVAGWFRTDIDFDPQTVDGLWLAEGDHDGFLAKLDDSGDWLWATTMGGAGRDGVTGVATRSSDTVYITGTFEETVDFDPGDDTYELIAVDRTDAFVSKFTSCSRLSERGAGRLLFPPVCTSVAAELTEDMYAETVVGIHRAPHEAYYLSSDGRSFAPLIVDDVLFRVNGVDSGLGPYDFRPGVPPVAYDVPIDENLVPLPAREITSLIPMGAGAVGFEQRDTQGEIYGSTVVYLVRDCSVFLEKEEAVALHWLSHAVEIGGAPSDLDVATGRISELVADADFSRACSFGSFASTTVVTDARPDPPPGGGDYYLVNGSCAQAIGYGNASDGARQGLPPGAACP